MEIKMEEPEASTQLGNELPSLEEENRTNFLTPSRKTRVKWLPSGELSIQWDGLLYAEKSKKMKRGRMKKANRKIILPLSRKDLKNTPLEEKALNWRAFLLYVSCNVLNIPQKYHGALLLLCGGFLSYQAKNLTTPFDFQVGKSTTTPQSLPSFGEALDVFFPEIAHITKFILCYILTLILVWPLQPGVQILFMLLLISAPLFYFPELVRKASGVDVACGPFKLPLIWFATLGALSLSLICGLLTLLVFYISWRFIHKGTPRVKEIEVSLDALSEILNG